MGSTLQGSVFVGAVLYGSTGRQYTDYSVKFRDQRHNPTVHISETLRTILRLPCKEMALIVVSYESVADDAIPTHPTSRPSRAPNAQAPVSISKIPTIHPTTRRQTRGRHSIMAIVIKAPINNIHGAVICSAPDLSSGST